MANPTPRLGLMRPTIASQFSTAELAENWGTVDASPGILLANSVAMPSLWGNNHRGMLVYATDQELYWRWDGTQFVRAFPVGLLGRSTRDEDFSTTSTASMQTAVSVDVEVPAGGLSVQVLTEWHKAESTAGSLLCRIERDSVVLAEFDLVGQTTPDAFYKRGQGGSRTVIDATPPPGQHTYSLRIRGHAAGTHYLRGLATSPVAVAAIEV